MSDIIQLAQLLHFDPVLAVVFAVTFYAMYKHAKKDEENADKIIGIFSDSEKQHNEAMHSIRNLCASMEQVARLNEKRIDRLENVTDHE